MVPLSMALSDLWPRFQGHNILWSRISEEYIARVCQHQLSFLFKISRYRFGLVFLVFCFASKCHMQILKFCFRSCIWCHTYSCYWQKLAICRLQKCQLTGGRGVELADWMHPT